MVATKVHGRLGNDDTRQPGFNADRNPQSAEQVPLHIHECIADFRNRSEHALGVIGAAVADAQEVGELARRGFGFIPLRA